MKNEESNATELIGLVIPTQIYYMRSIVYTLVVYFH